MSSTLQIPMGTKPNNYQLKRYVSQTTCKKSHNIIYDLGNAVDENFKNYTKMFSKSLLWICFKTLKDLRIHKCTKNFLHLIKIEL